MHEELLDHTGRVVARYDRRTRLELPYAADLEPVDIGQEELVELLLTQRKGWVVTASPALCLALKARGSTVMRHGHAYTFDLREQQVDPAWLAPELPAGLRFGPFDAPLEEVFPTMRRAFGPGHPDRVLDEEVDRRDFQRLVNGEVLGPLLASCSVLVLEGSRGVAGVVVNDRAGDPPLLGPWITQVYRDPDPEYRGLGGVVLRRSVALAAQAGLPAIGLAVSEGNPARELYEKTGFRHVEESMTVLIPD